jgi:hypothetical protein
MDGHILIQESNEGFGIRQPAILGDSADAVMTDIPREHHFLNRGLIQAGKLHFQARRSPLFQSPVSGVP